MTRTPASVRTRSAFVLAAALLGVTLGAFQAQGRHVSGRSGPLQQPTAQSTPRGNSSSCVGSQRVEVVTPTLRACDQSAITMTAQAICPLCPGGVNVFFVLQRWAFDPLWQAGEAQSVLEELEGWQQRFPNAPTVRVAVIVYDNEVGGAQVLVRLTDNIRSARSKLTNVPGLDSCLQGTACLCFAQLGNLTRVPGLIKGMLNDLKREQNLGDDDTGCNFAMLFNQSGFGDSCLGGSLVPDTSKTIRYGQQIEREVGTMLVGCPSDEIVNCEGAARMLQNKAFFSMKPRRNELRGNMKSLLDRLEDPQLLREVVLTQQLPPALDYVAASANISPTAMVTSAAGTTLTWAWDRIDVTGPHAVSYRVDPGAVGAFTVTGTMDILDEDGKHRIVPLDPAVLRVDDPCEPPPTATATATDTPTSTATPTLTPTATAPSTATSTPTRTPRPKPVYLPLALSERCDATRRASDVALVIDASTSMLEATGTGRTKMAAALAATRTFLDLMNLSTGRDRAAIVAFNAEARILAALTSDRAALEAALGAIAPAAQTCLPCAVDVAESALGPPIVGRTRTMVLLTDGRSNPRPVTEAVSRAAEAKANGVFIATVGLGDDLDFDALRTIASSDRHAYRSPDAADLEAIYTDIASLIPCPSFWPHAP